MAKAKKKTKEKIVGLSGVPATMTPEIVTYKITGISPLLQNNPVEFIGKNEVETLTPKKKVYNDEEEARLRLYPDGNGGYGHPCKAFTRACIRAVTGKKFGKLTATSAVRGNVFVVETLAIILDARGKPAKKYTIDKQPVVIGNARVLRCRPCWDKWQMRLPLEINTAILSPTDILDALQLAGRTVGVGDYRPECGGGFGRFTAELA